LSPGGPVGAKDERAVVDGEGRYRNRMTRGQGGATGRGERERAPWWPAMLPHNNDSVAVSEAGKKKRELLRPTSSPK